MQNVLASRRFYDCHIYLRMWIMYVKKIVALHARLDFAHPRDVMHTPCHAQTLNSHRHMYIVEKKNGNKNNNKIFERK